MAAVTSSPNKPRPADPLVRQVADALARIERNYQREGSSPGSRFEGELLEDVQARYAVNEVRSYAPREVADVTAGVATEALDLLDHLAHVLNDTAVTDRAYALRRRLLGEPS